MKTPSAIATPDVSNLPVLQLQKLNATLNGLMRQGLCICPWASSWVWVTPDSRPYCIATIPGIDGPEGFAGAVGLYDDGRTLAVIGHEWFVGICRVIAYEQGWRELEYRAGKPRPQS